MPFEWKSKTGRKRKGNDPKKLEEAVRAVVEKNKGLRETAREFEIDKQTLSRYVQKFMNRPVQNEATSMDLFTPNYTTRQFFTVEMENMLEQYLKKSSCLNYGLTPKLTQKLAFLFSQANNVQVPPSWTENESASRDWMKGFMKRHPSLSLRQPEATSLGRSTSFNRHNVGLFFDNLEAVMKKFNFGPQNIYNCDETGVQTTHRPGKIIAIKGTKQVGKMTSAERGPTVTICGTINALGNSIPPYIIYPRVRHQEYMERGSVAGTKIGRSQNGWMTSTNFEEYLDHFIKYSKPTNDNPVLLVFDNHESHISPAIITKAKETGIVLLTLPPHCSHRLQPLDRTVYGPFKAAYNRVADEWMLKNPGKPITLQTIGELIGQAIPLAFTPRNIISGFKSTGIFPFSRDIFNDLDFMPSDVTDRPCPTTTSVTAPTSLLCTTPTQPTISEMNRPTSTATPSQGPTSSEMDIVSPEDIMPFPKAEERKVGPFVKRKKGKSRILTSTPVKEGIEREFEDRCKRKLNLGAPNMKKKRESKGIWKPPPASSTSAPNSDDLCQESGSSDISFSSNSSSSDGSEEENLVIKETDFVVVKFPGKKNIIHYIGSVEKVIDPLFEYEVKFLRRQGIAFVYPAVEDKSIVSFGDVCRTVPLLRSRRGKYYFKKKHTNKYPNLR
ncbi:hypothetical protein LSTR_LSTR011388 [Laodelphax striatellus]|uniref:HTH CENPB-type domain-containing protein n=1 Tax=Laodelphax striatellus TaxID=195883 RepID=A0A482X8F6_LAOST|nr:hypothetical protein LSTR_LSTR011388 [Laodelphax striatellus]